MVHQENCTHTGRTSYVSWSLKEEKEAQSAKMEYRNMQGLDALECFARRRGIRTFNKVKNQRTSSDEDEYDWAHRQRHDDQQPGE